MFRGDRVWSPLSLYVLLTHREIPIINVKSFMRPELSWIERLTTNEYKDIRELYPIVANA